MSESMQPSNRFRRAVPYAPLGGSASSNKKITRITYRVNQDGTKTNISEDRHDAHDNARNLLASSKQSVSSSASSGSNINMSRSASKNQVATISYRVNPDGTKTKIVTTNNAATAPVDHVALNSSQQSVASGVTQLDESSENPLADQRQPLTIAEACQRRDSAIALYNARFKAFTEKVAYLVNALKKDHNAHIERQVARKELAEAISNWTEETPLKTSSDCTSIYAQADRLSTAYGTHFEEDVLQQAIQWEACIVSELDAELVEGKKACASVNHYERKVDSLRGQYSRAVNKNAEAAAQNLLIKLQRNEMKLAEATQKFEASSKHLQRCDELVDCAWMSLHPLLAQLFETDLEDSRDRAEAMSSLQNTLSEMSTSIRRTGLALSFSDSERVWRYLLAKGPSNLVPVTVGKPLDTVVPNAPMELVATPPDHILVSEAANGEVSQQPQMPQHEDLFEACMLASEFNAEGQMPERPAGEEGGQDGQGDLGDACEQPAPPELEEHDRTVPGEVPFQQDSDHPDDPPDDDDDDAIKYDNEPELARRDEETKAYYNGQDPNICTDDDADAIKYDNEPELARRDEETKAYYNGQDPNICTEDDDECAIRYDNEPELARRDDEETEKYYNAQETNECTEPSFPDTIEHEVVHADCVEPNLDTFDHEMVNAYCVEPNSGATTEPRSSDPPAF